MATKKVLDPTPPSLDLSGNEWWWRWVEGLSSSSSSENLRGLVFVIVSIIFSIKFNQAEQVKKTLYIFTEEQPLLPQSPTVTTNVKVNNNTYAKSLPSPTNKNIHVILIKL